MIRTGPEDVNRELARGARRRACRRLPGLLELAAHWALRHPRERRRLDARDSRSCVAAPGSPARLRSPAGPNLRRTGAATPPRAPGVSEHLTFLEEPEGLRRPLLIMAFSGWNDAAESATTAARYLSQCWSSRTIASIDPEEFYHFGLSRPYVRFKPGSRSEREIIWPATEFSLTQAQELDRDVIVGVAIEPHLKWRTYCAAVLEVARPTGAALVLTLGALLGEVAHTRPVRLSGSAHD